MTPAVRSPRRGDAGYSLIELIISTAIMITVTGAIFGLMNPAQGSAQAQPEVADMQQRMRVGSELFFKELVMSGAGPHPGPVRMSAHRLTLAQSTTRASITSAARPLRGRYRLSKPDKSQLGGTASTAGTYFRGHAAASRRKCCI